MVYSKLSDMIKYLQYGTKLHIGVLFLGNYGNDMVMLPHEQQIHIGVLCDEFKMRNFERCYRCRNRAIYKAIKTKKDFGGICINGIYEYTRPVIINDEVASIIFIGNIFDKEKGYSRLKENTGERTWMIDTLEQDFSEEKCREIGMLLESYIRLLLEKGGHAQLKNHIIENIKNFIEENLEFDIEISHISKIFHYNEQYLGRLFKREVGKSFKSYINMRRLEKAKRLLQGTEDTVITVSGNVGFNNVTYFNRIFKKQYGITPSQIRKSRSAK